MLYADRLGGAAGLSALGSCPHKAGATGKAQGWREIRTARALIALLAAKASWAWIAASARGSERQTQSPSSQVQGWSIAAAKSAAAEVHLGVGHALKYVLLARHTPWVMSCTDVAVRSRVYAQSRWGFGHSGAPARRVIAGDQIDKEPQGFRPLHFID